MSSQRGWQVTYVIVRGFQRFAADGSIPPHMGDLLLYFKQQRQPPQSPPHGAVSRPYPEVPPTPPYSPTPEQHPEEFWVTEGSENINATSHRNFAFSVAQRAVQELTTLSGMSFRMEYDVDPEVVTEESSLAPLPVYISDSFHTVFGDQPLRFFVSIQAFYNR